MHRVEMAARRLGRWTFRLLALVHHESNRRSFMPRKDDDTTGFTGKRNKSWREIDANRGSKSKYNSRQDDPQQQRIERSASYERYKRAADAVFSGGVMPDSGAHGLDPD